MDIKNVEEIFSLSPLQEAVLFNEINNQDLERYCGQFTCELYGFLNVSVFERAWQQILDSHPILRSFFVWKRLDKPLRVVHKSLKLSLDKHDWRLLLAEKQQEHLKACLETERTQGIDPANAPLVRLNLCQISEDVHQLICTYHYLVLDDKNFHLLLKQVFACYEAFYQGQNWQSEQKRPYRDYVAWLKRQDISKAEAFWRQTLEGFTVPTPLGQMLISSHLCEQEQRYAEQRLQISAVVTAKLQYLATEHQLNLNTFVQGAWALLLSRYSGEEDVILGTMVSGEPPILQEGEYILGSFTNMLPMRVKTDPSSPVLSWLKHLETQQVSLQQYQYNSLLQIQSWSEVPDDLPLFESNFVFENHLLDNLLQKQFGKINLCHIQTFKAINFPITVKAEWNTQLTVHMNYDRYRFDDSTITRILEHIQSLLKGMVAEPKQSLSRLPLLSESELQQLLIEWNDTKTDYPQGRCIHQLFEAQEERSPEAVAVVFEGKQLTYRELNSRANQLAHYLRTLGVGLDVLVGLCVERSLEMLIGLLGILKAGGAYVPIDPEYPQERISHILSDSQASLLLTQQHLVTRLPEHQVRVVCIDEVWEKIVQHSQQNPVSGVSDSNLVNVIYTSGSTGKPKGVMVKHSGLCNLAQAQIELFDLRPSSRILQFASFSFDASVWEIVMAWGVGATLYLGTKDSLIPDFGLIRLLREYDITHITLPPSALAVLPLEELPALKTMIVAGEACAPNLIKQWSVGRRFFNAYGPTEATVCATVAEYLDENDKLPIGRPIPNTQVYILDRYLQPVPVGVPGELHIGGAGLAQGYLNRPKLTTEKFIPNPFKNSQLESELLYKTGDLACYLPDGNIEYLGRIDHQVKVRGFRIELGEIETVLSQHPAALQVTVIAREDVPGDKRLVAYLVFNEEEDTTVNDLRQFLSSKLPDYMIPSAFVFLETLPLTPNGKVDRQSLPAPDVHRELEASFVAPTTSIEETLAKIWADILNLEQVGIHDNFFDLGGDSILALQIITRANQAGLQLVRKQLFAHQTIAELAAVAGTTEKIQAEQGLVSGTLPLTPIQHWFFEQNLPEPHHFNQSILLSVPANVQPELLEQVLQQLPLHHDALRLRFTLDGADWQQVNTDLEETVPLSVVDLSTIPALEQPAALENAGSELQASLNLSTGPLMRVALFKLDNNQPHRLLVILHHLVVDGVSWRILLEDLFNAYQQLSQGEGIQLPLKTSSFKDWAHRLAEYGRSPALTSELDYWMESGFNFTFLPIDYPADQDANNVAATAQISRSLSLEETRALLQEVPAVYNTQINDVLLTALVQSFARWTGSDFLLVDIEGHGREELFDDLDLSRTIGWFTSLFPVHLQLEQTNHPGNMLKSVKEQLRQLPNRGIGYSILRYLSQNAEKLKALPQAQVSFNYLGQLDQELSEANNWQFAIESGGAERNTCGNRSYLLDINASVINHKLQINWIYSQKVHQQNTVEHLADWFMETLQTLINHCQSTNVGGYTSSDFPEVNLSQEEIDDLDRIFAF